MFEDQRKWIVFGSIFVSILVSLLTWFIFPNLRDVATFQGSVFASWTAGLLLTLAVTLSITLVSLSRPESDDFETRARNFLRRQKGPHIDFVVEKLRSVLEAYCEEMVREMTIAEWHEETNLLRVNQVTKTTLRNYVTDSPLKTELRLRYWNATLAPEGRQPNSLTYLKVQGDEIFRNQTFEERIDLPYEIIVNRDRPGNIEDRLVYWIEAGKEANTHTNVRFARLERRAISVQRIGMT